MLTNETSNVGKLSKTVLVLFLTLGLLIGSLAAFFISYSQVAVLNSQVNDLTNQVSALKGSQNAIYQNITINNNGTYLSSVYANVSKSVVMLQATLNDGSGYVQGSGFVYEYTDTSIGTQMIVITNYHVVEEVVARTATLSVTFMDGNGYAAQVMGYDPYADLAVVSVIGASSSEFIPVTIASSSVVHVGDEVIVIGNPYGLVGSLTTGVVSALGRTITEDESGGYAIADVIQTDAAINAGNSGGPLLNAAGSVIGITTAIVSDSVGLGFAIPSDTILRELYSLVHGQTYTHSYLGITGQDMSYAIAQEYGLSVTYGWRVASVTNGGPSSGILNAGDVIIAFNGTRIRNGDDLSTFLEANTRPGDNVAVTIARGSSMLNVTVTLGIRPAIT